MIQLIFLFLAPQTWAHAASPLRADLLDAHGEKVGTAELSSDKEPGRLDIQVQGKKLAPGKHGIHLHEKGLCEGPDFKSAGGHFRKEGQKHGLKQKGAHHFGDLPNLLVSQDGTFSSFLSVRDVKLEDIRGKALVIHEKEDDQKTDPAGDSGARMVCGVIVGASP